MRNLKGLTGTMSRGFVSASAILVMLLTCVSGNAVAQSQVSDPGQHAANQFKPGIASLQLV